MPRALRYQYAGAVYHLMARGDGGKAVFVDDEDRKGFLFRLAKVCGSHGWRVHAWVLMNNHFHLLAKRLAMGHPGSVSRLVVSCSKNATQTREREKPKKMLKCDT